MKSIPTIAACEKAIGVAAERWKGRCFEIASAIVAAKLVRGTAVYGHWLGEVNRKSFFYHEPKRPFIQHGWILLADSRVLDPTRWVFEAKAPYLFVGEPPDDWDINPCRNCGLLKEEHNLVREGYRDLDDCGHYEIEHWPYDEGGNRWRAAFIRPPPAPKPGDKRIPFFEHMERRTAEYVGELGELFRFSETAEPFPDLTVEQIFWLANLPYDELMKLGGEDAIRDVYSAICQTGYGAAIPMDNRLRAERAAAKLNGKARVKRRGKR